MKVALLTESVHFSHFEYKTLKALRKLHEFVSPLTESVHFSHFEYKTLKALRKLHAFASHSPALCAHKPPPFLGHSIKQRGLLPLTQMTQNI